MEKHLKYIEVGCVCGGIAKPIFEARSLSNGIRKDSTTKQRGVICECVCKKRMIKWL